jgi:hypothetical protein
VTSFIFIWVIGLMIFSIIVQPESLYPPKGPDESVYANISTAYKQGGISALIEMNDDKPLTFLLLQSYLNASNTIIFTRGFNFVLIIICTIFIFKITANKLACLFPIIPAFLNSMWLTVEIIEVFFILLSLMYGDKRGWFIGLAAIFRPYAVMYMALLDKKNIIKALVIGGIYAGLLYLSGGFFVYLNTVLGYGRSPYDDGLAVMGIILFIPMALLGNHNKTMFKWGVIASLPILLRPGWGHYYLPAYSLFFIGYLWEENVS